MAEARGGHLFKRVTSGDRLSIRAGTWNAILASAEAHQFGGRASFGAGALGDRKYGSVRVKVLNETGQDLDRFSVVHLGKPIGGGLPVVTPNDNLDEFQNNPVLKVGLPNVQSPGHLGILQEAIPAGRFGYCTVRGLSVARIKGPFALRADVAVDSSPEYLESYRNGCIEVIYQQGSSGVSWALVLIGSRPPDDSLSGLQKSPTGANRMATIEIDRTNPETGVVNLRVPAEVSAFDRYNSGTVGADCQVWWDAGKQCYAFAAGC